MAVKLSSVTVGSTIKVPTISGRTIDGIVMQYNHFGKGEVCVLLKDYLGAPTCGNPRNFPSRPPNRTDGYGRDDKFYSYEGSVYDLYCESSISSLANSIKNALIPVPISIVDGIVIGSLSSGMTSFTNATSFKTKTVNRSVFLPSGAEVDMSTSYYHYVLSSYDGLITNGTTGSRFTLFDNDKNRNLVNLILRDPCINASSSQNKYLIRFLETSTIRSTSAIGSDVIYKKFDNRTSGYTNNYYYSVDYMDASGEYDDEETAAPVVLSLNGGLMVESTSGGAITSSTAVETYRKINGTWYRTD